ncbi:preprotein translocase subunit SecG [Paracoccus jiaweipingae]|uniref:preprotein translocase subunit SecG n=1 Tax=unclassified Paracoccus (in: a-proteobacteria) TaxID=2688777 RepID=UPI00378F4F40
MENVVLTVHLILAVLLIGVVLLQRSEGGGLGMGGGGGGVMTGRQAANALSKLTWVLAIGFLITSVTLTVIAARNSAGSSVMDQIGAAPAEEQSQAPALDYTPPPGSTPAQNAPAAGEPVVPPVPAAPAADTPATEAPATGTPAQPAADAPVTPPAAQAPAAEPATQAPATPAN